MNKITGRLIHKSLIKKGQGQFGEWKIVEFMIEKSFQKKKYKALFAAKGKWADFIEQVPVKEKITVHYIIDSKEFKGRWFTDLRAIEIEKYVKKDNPHVYFEDRLVNKSDFEINPDLQLPLSNNIDKGDKNV